MHISLLLLLLACNLNKLSYLDGRSHSVNYKAHCLRSASRVLTEGMLYIHVHM